MSFCFMYCHYCNVSSCHLGISFRDMVYKRKISYHSAFTFSLLIEYFVNFFLFKTLSSRIFQFTVQKISHKLLVICLGIDNMVKIVFILSACLAVFVNQVCLLPVEKQLANDLKGNFMLKSFTFQKLFIFSLFTTSFLNSLFCFCVFGVISYSNLYLYIRPV